MAAKPQTSDERKRAFNALFETVKADGEGTAMGSTDKARDEALGGLTFDKLPDHAPEYQVPEVPKPKAESTDLMEESHEGRDVSANVLLRFGPCCLPSDPSLCSLCVRLRARYRTL